MEVLFFGTYIRKIDSKGRVSVLAEFRDNLDSSLIILENASNASCFTKPYLQELIKKNGIDILPKIREAKIEQDGRIVLKHKNTTATFLGKGSFFEIQI